MWKRISRSAPGRRADAYSRGRDRNAQASVSSARKKIAPSSRTRSSAALSGAGLRSVCVSIRPGTFLMVVTASRMDTSKAAAAVDTAAAREGRLVAAGVLVATEQHGRNHRREHEDVSADHDQVTGNQAAPQRDE